MPTPTCHVAPLTGVHVDPSVWPLATRPRHLCLARASRGSAMWPQCHVASTQWSRAPRQLAAWARSPRHHLQVINYLFRDFSKENINKNQIKIGKRHKLQKFITLNIQFLFNPNFLHWITNFFLFNIMSFKIYFQRRNQDELEFT